MCYSENLSTRNKSLSLQIQSKMNSQAPLFLCIQSTVGETAVNKASIYPPTHIIIIVQIHAMVSPGKQDSLMCWNWEELSVQESIKLILMGGGGGGGGGREPVCAWKLAKILLTKRLSLCYRILRTSEGWISIKSLQWLWCIIEPFKCELIYRFINVLYVFGFQQCHFNMENLNFGLPKNVDSAFLGATSGLIYTVLFIFQL